MRNVFIGEFTPWTTAAFDASVDTGCEYSVTVDSYGGDVIELQRIKQLIESKGLPRSVTVRTACSCGANLVAWLAANGVACSCVDSAVVFFHSAFSYAGGGAEEMETTLDAIKAINACAMENLKTLGMSDDDIAACFTDSGKWFIGSAAIIEAHICSEVCKPVISAYCCGREFVPEEKQPDEPVEEIADTVVKSSMQRKVVANVAASGVKSIVIRK